MINWIKVLLIGFSTILFSFQDGDDIRYFQLSTVPIVDSLATSTISIYDSIPEQEIFQVKAASGTPLYYYIELHTGVCFDNKCRPLSILVFWNITGRYLGFELLDGEFLSKYDHEPFKPFEYERLNKLLADPFLPLGEYTFEELVKIPDTINASIDGVSGATSHDVLDYVVEGAAYTTYKLWNVVYGPIQQTVISLTEAQMNSMLFSKILQSPDPSDRTWALERISLIPELDDLLIDSFIDIILDGEYFQAYLLLRSITLDQLKSEMLQVKLFNVIRKTDYNLENLIFQELMSAPYLSKEVIDASIPMLKSISGPQLINLLKLYKHHQVNDPNLCRALREVVGSQNNYVRNQILNFLEGSTCK